MLSSIRDPRTKKQGNKGTAKSCKTRKVRCTCGHLIRNSVLRLNAHIASERAPTINYTLKSKVAIMVCSYAVLVTQHYKCAKNFST